MIESVTGFLERKLKLRVNKDKSAAGRVDERTFLEDPLLHNGSLGVSAKIINRFKQRVRELNHRSRPGRLAERIENLNRYLIGWGNYYRLIRSDWNLRGLDQWIRRKM